MADLTTLNLLRLRLLVGYLGERKQHAWWQTGFFEPSSSAFLSPVFTKTVPLAQYNGIREAARLAHDDHIGVGRVFHLFRLPEEVEQNLHLAMREQAPDSPLLKECADPKSALQALASFGDAATALHEGPLSMGKVEGLLNGKGLAALASTYRFAFEANIKTYPYFAS